MVFVHLRLISFRRYGGILREVWPMVTRRTWYIAFLLCCFSDEKPNHACFTIQSVSLTKKADHASVFCFKIHIDAFLIHTDIIHHMYVHINKQGSSYTRLTTGVATP